MNLTREELDALADAIAARLADRLPARGRRRVEQDRATASDERALERMGLRKPEPRR